MENIMKDVRLLTLYKQHYLDYYGDNLKSGVSCLGYYDGIDVKKIEDKVYSQLFQKKSQAPISELWYSTGEKIEEIKGGYSNQNIGLFRGISDDDVIKVDRFWEKDGLPFFAVGFAKIKYPMEYEKVANQIDMFEVSEKGEPICNILSYFTFDNADLVIFLKSNSLMLLTKIQEKIEELDEIVYFHPILGIFEDYLQACMENKEILRFWRGKNCYIDEFVKRINMQLATSGDKKVINAIKGYMSKWNDEWNITGYDNLVYSYVGGHANISILLSDTDVRTIIVLLLQNGVITHKNPVYEGGLYNIQSTIIMNEKKFNEIETGNVIYEKQRKPGLCRRLVKEYAKEFTEDIRRKDEGLYSYYQSLILTINTLDQYENFELSRNVFWLVFPSLVMFDIRFRTLLNWAKESTNEIDLPELKNSMYQYIEYVNSIIYHTVHTDQIYLMIPGYSGTSYSIPIKLNLFYLWFLDTATEIISNQERKYSYILTPTMEARPRTQIVDVGSTDKGRLVNVQLSQRLLFLPRNLMIILLHELGHYAGGELRCRKKRMDCLIRTLAYYLAEGIFPEEYNGGAVSEIEKKLFEKLKGEIKHNLQEKILFHMGRNFKNNCTDDKYHGVKIELPLKQLCFNVISDEGIGVEIKDIIFNIPNEVMRLIEEDKAQYVSRMQYVYEVQCVLDKNRKILLSSQFIEILVRILINLYQEVFSDMIALTILDCCEQDFHEAFFVSEGMKSANGIKKIQQQIREDIAKEVVYEDESEQYFENKMDEESNSCVDEESLLVNIVNYEWFNNYLIEYAEECKIKIKNHIITVQPHINKIRGVYEKFNSMECDCMDIYECINDCIDSYTKNVEESYNRLMQEQ